MNVNFIDHIDIDKDEFLIERKRLWHFIVVAAIKDRIKERRPLWTFAVYSQKYNLWNLVPNIVITLDLPQNCCYYCYQYEKYFLKPIKNYYEQLPVKKSCHNRAAIDRWNRFWRFLLKNLLTKKQSYFVESWNLHNFSLMFSFLIVTNKV